MMRESSVEENMRQLSIESDGFIQSRMSIGAGDFRRWLAAGSLSRYSWRFLYDAELTHHAKRIDYDSAFSILTVDDANYADAGENGSPAGGREAPQVATMRPFRRPAGDYLVPFGDLLVDCDVYVGEPGAGHGNDELEPFGAAQAAAGVERNVVGRGHLIDNVEVAFVKCLINDTPDESLVRFRNRASPLGESRNHAFDCIMPCARGFSTPALVRNKHAVAFSE